MALFLEDLKGHTQAEVKAHLIKEYGATKEDMKRFRIEIAYESVGAWGCDSSSFFLLREKSTGDLYEVHGSHCSCFGFEDQFEPEKTTLQYLKSDKFHFTTGGYDYDRDESLKSVASFIKRMRK